MYNSDEFSDMGHSKKYSFSFLGGAQTTGVIVKFLLFVKATNSEFFLSEAVAKGFVQRHQILGHYATNVNYLKIFYKESGFGTEYLYQSFFFKLQEEAKFEYTIRPLSTKAPGLWEFKAKGCFMSDTEIREHFSTEGDLKDSYFYYTRQMALSKATIDRMIFSKALAPKGIIVDQNEDFRFIR